MKRFTLLAMLSLGAGGPLTYIAQTLIILNSNDGYINTERNGETETTRFDQNATTKKRTKARRQVQGQLFIPQSKPKPEKQQISAFSYSIFGNNTKYTQGMIEAAAQIPKIFPSWQVRVYYDASVPSSIISQLSQMQLVKLVNVTRDLPDWVSRTVHPSAYRFLVASDPSVLNYAIRDSDSRPSVRERAAIEEWLKSEKDFHIMRDSPFHRPQNMGPILAGMWGGRHRAVPNMDILLREYYSTKRLMRYGQDQDFLWEKIMPLAYNRTWQHDSYSCVETGGTAFPMTREESGDPDDYIGRPFYVNLPPNMKTVDPLMKKPYFVEKEKLCLEVRIMLIAQAKKVGKAYPRDLQTIYRGNVTGSSVDVYEAAGGRRKSIH